MNHFIYCLLLFSFFSCSYGQNKFPEKDSVLRIDSSWQKKAISSVLNVSLPDSSVFNKNGILNASFGEGKYGLYGVDFFDTVIVAIDNEADFEIALKGYMAGKFSDPQLTSLDLTVSDTTLGNSTGLFMVGYTNDSLASCKSAFCYLTMANNNFYWFYACQPTSVITDETRQFFNSIQFIREKVKESDYKLHTISLHKNAE